MSKRKKLLSNFVYFDHALNAMKTPFCLACCLACLNLRETLFGARKLYNILWSWIFFLLTFEMMYTALTLMDHKLVGVFKLLTVTPGTLLIIKKTWWLCCQLVKLLKTVLLKIFWPHKDPQKNCPSETSIFFGNCCENGLSSLWQIFHKK